MQLMFHLLTAASSDKTPIELFTGTKPNISHLRLFGCKVLARKPSEHLKGNKKLEERTTSGYFIGYTNHPSIYLVVSSDYSSVYRATNVYFQENFISNNGTKIENERSHNQSVNFEDNEDEIEKMKMSKIFNILMALKLVNQLFLVDHLEYQLLEKNIGELNLEIQSIMPILLLVTWIPVFLKPGN